MSKNDINSQIYKDSNVPINLKRFLKNLFKKKKILHYSKILYFK